MAGVAVQVAAMMSRAKSAESEPDDEIGGGGGYSKNDATALSLRRKIDQPRFEIHCLFFF